MAKTKEQKAAIIEKLESAFKNAGSAVFVHFEKIHVTEETVMRRGFRQDGISYIVAKKSLIRRALEGLGLPHKELTLEGEVSVAFDSKEANDPTGPARRVWNFAKQIGAEKLSILGGIFEGKIVGAQEMTGIATIPPIPVLRGMFLNVINSPIAGLAIALKAIADKKS